MTELAQLIRRRRLELGLTQRAAAELAEISLATWQNLERPSSKPDGFQDLTLARVAQGLDLDLPLVFRAAGRALPDPASLPPARGDTGPPSADAGDTDELIGHLVGLLRRLAAASAGSFLVVYGQAAEAAQHLLELHGDRG